MSSKRILGLFSVPLANYHSIDNGQTINGSDRASLDFFSNIYKHGCFDEYHCFVPNRAAKEDNVLDDKRFVVLPYRDLKESVQKQEYTAFHHLDPRLRTDLVSMRNSNSKNLFPITTTTHTISYAYMPKNIFAPYCYYPLYPFDAILASSKAVQKTLSYFFQQIRFSVKRENKTLGYPGKIPILPLGIDIEELNKHSMEKDLARSCLNIPQATFVILYFGRISVGTKSDLLPLLQCYHRLVISEQKKCLLVIAGGGDDSRGKSLYSNRHKLLEKFVAECLPEDSVKLFYSPSDKLKSTLYSAADIFVSLSDNIQESFGLTVLEAQAMGLPVVVSDWDGYRDIVEHGVTGYCVPTYWYHDSLLDDLSKNKKIEYYHFRQAQAVAVDLEYLFDCLQKLIHNPSHCKELGQKAKVFAKQYSWEKSISRYEQFWLELSRESKNITNRYTIEHLRRTKQSKKTNANFRKFTISYYEAFHHFSTQIVDHSWQVRTSYMKSILIEAMTRNLSKSIILGILDHVDKMTSSNETVSIKYLINKLGYSADYNKINDEEFMRHIMWLFKQGILHCCPTQ